MSPAYAPVPPPADHAGAAKLQVVGLGEALFDCFPDRTVLGGAPLNFAYHANQLLGARGRGVPVSRIGQDDLGQQLLAEVANRGITTDYLQLDPTHPTGTVQVTLTDQGQPSYEIKTGVAWDHLECDTSLKRLAAGATAVCYGTLAQRHEQSRSAIAQFLAAAGSALKVCDINLRQDDYSAEVLRTSFAAATLLKINDEELPVACTLLEIAAHESTDQQVSALREEFHLQQLALTRGAQGTVLYTSDGRFDGQPVSYPSQPYADSVGAGDSCCAAILIGILLQQPPAATVALANQVGAFVAAQPGATVALPPEILALIA